MVSVPKRKKDLGIKKLLGMKLRMKNFFSELMKDETYIGLYTN